MGFFGLLFVLLVTACSGLRLKCVQETAKCSRYWVKMEPHRNLMETEDELNTWCSTQNRFYECLEDVLLEGKNGNLSYLPTNLLISKLFAKDLCSDGSTSRRRLFNNAHCINRLNTEYCTLPEYLDIVTPDDAIPASRCSMSEKTFSCIAATIVLNCGFDAGRVYRNMLKITRYSDEVCDIEASEGIPPCEDGESKTDARQKELSEIYYGLFHRIGTIEDEDTSENKVSQSDRTQGGEITIEQAVTEAIKTALDDLDKNTISERFMNDGDSTSTRRNSKVKPYMKNPIITDVFKGILFYNYSSQEYAAYWRQPEFVVIENITCEHLQPSYMRGVIFRCKIEYRDYDPDCISKSDVHEKVTPELIRELDPEVPEDSITEFGPRPEWMSDLDDAYKEKMIRDKLKTSTAKPLATDSSVFVTSSSLLHMASTLNKKEKPENWWEFEFSENTMNSIFPNDIHYELMELFMPEPEKYVPPPMNRIKVGHTLFFLIYDPLLTNSVENLTCSRLDECHPRARGLWKCRMWRRKIETCDVCYGGTGATILGLPETYASPANKETDSQFHVLETTEPTAVNENSGMLADAPRPEETITLIFSGDETANYETRQFEYPAIVELSTESDTEEAESEEEVEDNVVKESEDELSEDVDLRLKILASVIDSDSDAIPKLIYTIDEIDSEGGGKESDVSLGSDELGLLDEDVLILKKVSDAIGNEYKIISTSRGDEE